MGYTIKHRSACEAILPVCGVLMISWSNKSSVKWKVFTLLHRKVEKLCLYKFSRCYIGKGNGICLKSRHPWSPMHTPVKVCQYRCSLHLLIKPWIWALGPVTDGWTEAVWDMKFARHFCTWPALRLEPQTFWCWVNRSIHLSLCFSNDGNKLTKKTGKTIKNLQQHLLACIKLLINHGPGPTGIINIFVEVNYTQKGEM